MAPFRTGRLPPPLMVPEVDHTDVLTDLQHSGGIWWRALREPAVTCRVRIFYLAEGSLDPIAARVLQWIRASPEAVAIDTLAAGLGVSEALGYRVLAEIVYAFVRAAVVFSVEASGKPRFVASRDSANDLHDACRPHEESTVRDFLFSWYGRMLVTDQRAYPKPALDAHAYPWWGAWCIGLPPGADLDRTIEHACARFYTSRSVVENRRVPVRHEALQRSGLLKTETRYLDASVVPPGPASAGSFVYRCYLWRAGTAARDEWQYDVRRWPRGPKLADLTRALREWLDVPSNRAIRDAFISSAERIGP
jgi:hypothetical protein